MLEKVKSKVKEAILSIVPVMLVMMIVGICLGFNIVTFCSILIGTIFLIGGVSLFTIGSDLSMLEIGKMISSSLLRTKKVFIISFVCFIVGVVITVAEPDLRVLASQMTAIDSSTLILCVSVGVGIFLCIAALRIMYQASLKLIVGFFYCFLIFLLFISNKEMIPLAFDAGGVTTGPMSVPFILAMGIGFSKSRKRNNSSNDSFGLVALCSIGPIITVLLLGLLINSDMSYVYNINPEVTRFSDLIYNYCLEFFPIFKDVLISLFPILSLFVVFCFISKEISKRNILKILIGLVITVVGLVLFFIGVNVSYMPIAYLIGIEMYNLSKVLLVFIGLVIGFVIVKAEPAVAVLTEQIENITQGSIKRSVMNNTIAIGVSVSVCISILRVISGVSIINFLVLGYLLVILLMLFSNDMFTMVAFDAGGAVTGPMTTSFLLPLIIGICYSSGGNVLTDAFGLVALVAMSPLITIQILGIIYKFKSSKMISIDEIDESIIVFKRRDNVE